MTNGGNAVLMLIAKLGHPARLIDFGQETEK